MFQKSSVYIRPFESRDLRILKEWRKLDDWPKDAQSTMEKNSEGLPFCRGEQIENVILIAELPGREAIGIAHLTAHDRFNSNVQYSVAIPDPCQRTCRRAKDLLLLSIGAAFYVYGHLRVICLVNSGNRKLIEMCLKGGFREDTVHESGALSDAVLRRKVLSATSSTWMAIWGAELAQKGRQVPWFNLNAAWSEIDHANSVDTIGDQSGDNFERLTLDCPPSISAHEEYGDYLDELPPPKILG
ncbi:MAG: hypothetical protein FVQ79_03720 [Planctomycetes bacterium]|nr:hypothetical protein [Planctomycetota bacterium]